MRDGFQIVATRMALLLAALGTTVSPALAQAELNSNPYGEWRYIWGDMAGTRYSPLDQINASNFETLETAWVWRGDNYGRTADGVMRSTPIYADGILYTVAGTRRQVIAIDPATGETLWTFREPHTIRWERSPRQNYGRGVAYAEVDGRGVIYVVTPAFFMHALDAKTGEPIEGFGGQIPIEGFPETGSVDMLATLGHPYDVNTGIELSRGAITTSSPPLVVNGVIIVGNSAHQGGGYSRIENVPGDVQAFDARTGRHLWTFHTIPRAGEFGNETWENDSWRFVGNVNVWAPLTADPELNLVYLPTDAPTNDYFGGFRPGNNLFGSSLVAVDVRTGQRRWHFQMIHHDIWDWDLPVSGILADVTVDGREIPAIVQTSKQTFVYAFNRATGEPIWPIVERPVPQGDVPGEWYSPTQPFPTRPAPYELQGLSIDDLADFTPEIRQMAIERTRDVKFGPIFTPYVHTENPQFRATAQCPSATGGTNIPGGPVMDPETGILYVQSRRACSGGRLGPPSEPPSGASNAPAGAQAGRGGRGGGAGPGAAGGGGRGGRGGGDDEDAGGGQPGSTPVDFVSASGGGLGTLEGGLPIFKPPYGKITAIDMNTGEHLWWIPNGETPDRFRNNPLVQGIDIGNTGSQTDATVLVTRSLLMWAEGRGGRPVWYAADKQTGERIGEVELPAPSSTAPMTYLHDGVQYIVVPIAGGGIPGSLVALRLPQ
jgi:glucose dehydrogenase